MRMRAVHAWPLSCRPFFRQNIATTRRKTTVYIDEAPPRAAKVAATRPGEREYEVFEDALRRHLGFGGTLGWIWAASAPRRPRGLLPKS